ncbi:MAG: efflux RND transporter periplasmic adaptor subunit [Acidobacteriota bacterium]
MVINDPLAQNHTQPAAVSVEASKEHLVVNEDHPDYQFTETFYGQLITNLDEVFEELFLSTLEESLRDQINGNPQLGFDIECLRMLFVDIANIYVAPLKDLLNKLEKREAHKTDLELVKLSLSDISRAGSVLGLHDMCSRLNQLIKLFEEIITQPTIEITPVEREAISLHYANLVEILPQVFAIEGFQRPLIPVIPAPKDEGTKMTLSLAAARSDLIVYYYPPRIHKQVEVTEQQDNGRTLFWFKDTISNRYFKAGQRERDIITLIDGTHTLTEIQELIRERMRFDVDLRKLATIIAKLDTIGLIDGVKRPEIKTTETFNLAQKKFSLVNPDNFLTKLHQLIPWVFTKTFVITSCLSILLVMMELSSHYREFIAQTKALASHGWLFFLVGWSIICLHEIGHGLTCKHYGGRVTDMGFMLFYYVLPAGYCNVSDIYLFKNKWHRVYVLLAGLYTQFLIAALAAGGWLLFAPSSIISNACCIIFWGATSSTVINLIPLLKLDGYYIITNVLGEYNLQAQSINYTKQIIGYLFFGDPIKQERLHTRQVIFYSCYGSLQLALMVLFPFFICGSVTYYLCTDQFDKLGIILLILFIRFVGTVGNYLLLLLKTFYRILKTATAPGVVWTVRLRAIMINILLMTIVLLPTCGNLSQRITAKCWLAEHPDNYTPVVVQTSGIVKQILVSDNALVTAGQTIAVLENPHLALEIEHLGQNLAELIQREHILQEQLREHVLQIDKAKLQQQGEHQLAMELQSEVIALDNPAPSYPANLAVVKNFTEKAQERVNYRASVLKQQEKLLAAKLISPLVLEKTRLDYQQALKHKQVVQEQLNKEIEEHYRQAEQAITRQMNAHYQMEMEVQKLAVLQAKSQTLLQTLASKRAEYQLALRQQEQLKITAPQAGRITRIVQPLKKEQVENSSPLSATTSQKVLEESWQQMVNAGTELCRISNNSQLRVMVAVPEGQIELVQIGQTVCLRLSAIADQEFTAKIEHISQEAVVTENQGRFYQAYLLIDNHNGLLRPGMSGIAIIEIGTQPCLLVVQNYLKQIFDYFTWLP